MIRIIIYFIAFVIITALSVFFKHTLGDVRFSMETVSYELPTVLLLWINILVLFAIYILYTALKFLRFLIKIPFIGYGLITSNDKDVYIKDLICDLALDNDLNSAVVLKKLSKNDSELAKLLKAIVLFYEGKYDEAHEILFTISSYANTSLHNLKRICYYKSSTNKSKGIELDYFLQQTRINEKIACILIEQVKKENNTTALANIYKKTKHVDEYLHMQMKSIQEFMDNDDLSQSFKSVEKIIKEHPTNIEALRLFNELCIKTNQQKKVFKVLKDSWKIQPSQELGDLFIDIFKDDKKNIVKYMNELITPNPQTPESIILKAKLGLAVQVWSITTDALNLEPNRDLTPKETRQLNIIQADLLEYKDNNPQQANAKRLEIIQSL